MHMRYIIVMPSDHSPATFYAGTYPDWVDPAFAYSPTPNLFEAGTWYTKEEAQAIIDKYHAPKGRRCYVCLIQHPDTL